MKLPEERFRVRGRTPRVARIGLFLLLAASASAGALPRQENEKPRESRGASGRAGDSDEIEGEPSGVFMPSELDLLEADLAAADGRPWSARRYYREECQKCHGRYGDGDPEEGVPAFATRRWLEERGPHTEELLDIILNGKDKMEGHAGRITGEQARELLEGVRTIARKYAEDLAESLD